MNRFKEVTAPIPLFSKHRIKRWIRRIINDNNYQCGDIIYYFCNDKEIRRINREYLKHDYATDIITFSYSDNKIISGEMFLGIETIYKNAEFYNEEEQNELFRVVIHGVLHLVGYDDQTVEDQLVMTNEENKALEMLYSRYLRK